MFNCCLNPSVELVVKVWTLIYCKKQDTRIRIMTRIKKRKEKERGASLEEQMYQATGSPTGAAT